MLTVASSASLYQPAFYPSYYQPAYFVDQRGIILQPIVTPRQGLISNLVNGVWDILNPGSEGGQNDQRPSGDVGSIAPEDVQAIWISGFPIRRTIPVVSPVGFKY